MTEKTFVLRFSLSPEVPDALIEDADFDDSSWLAESE
jgi:hypothetical protein